MTPEPLQNLELLYLAKENFKRSGSNWLAFLEPSELPKAAANLLSAGYHIEDICGLDAQEGACAVYHFDHFQNPCRISLVAIAPYTAPTFPSIAGIFQGAEWHERETRDFFGYCFAGNPNFIPLLIAETMVDVHPLQKDEDKRAPLRKFFALEGAVEELVHKKPGFTFLDALPEPPAESQKAPAAAAQEGKA
ncbi:MAG: NADH-quinone oxidoreductase subunit C [Deltaproteobacteria bacterium]|jgi:NADH-quinone oxidoreductase subunit C|nr:NADH-quinone oxidoreductase subunit C [Deltaproteobacteria bacterium]